MHEVEHICTTSSLRIIADAIFFFFNATATTEIYTLSLHDALPIFGTGGRTAARMGRRISRRRHAVHESDEWKDRKSTRLNSSHRCISYAVFCLKKKKRRRRVHHQRRRARDR